MKTNYSVKAHILCAIHSTLLALLASLKYPDKHFLRDLKLEFNDNMLNIFLYE